MTAPAMLDLSLTSATALRLSKSQPTPPGVPQPTGRVSSLLRFRAANPVLFESRRVEGMRRSELVRENLMRIHRECKAQWRKSALKNPRLRATDSHIAAKEWTLLSPKGQLYTFRNLKKFVREHADLFAADDVIWKEPQGKPNQAWCRAFQALSRLRPTCSKLLPEWNGWRWAGAV